MYRCSVELSVQYDGQSQSQSEHASLIDEHDSFNSVANTDPICVLNTGFDCMINRLVQFCSETLPTQPSVRYARFQHWICSSGSTGEHNGCLPFTWRNRLVDGLCKWKAKFPYWKFPFGVACTI